MSGFTIRPATAADSPELAALVRGLGHHLSPDTIAANLASLEAQDLPQFVAVAGDALRGLAGFDVMTPLYRAHPVGRLTILIVDEAARGRGIAKALVSAVADEARRRGCGMLEVTSNERLTDAHAFYRHLGFDQTSKRFALVL